MLNFYLDFLLVGADTQSKIEGTEILNSTLTSGRRKLVRGYVLSLLRTKSLVDSRNVSVRSENGTTTITAGNLILQYDDNIKEITVNKEDSIHLFPLLTISDATIKTPTVPNIIDASFVQSIGYDDIYDYIESNLGLFEMVRVNHTLSQWGDMGRFILQPLDFWDDESRNNIEFNANKFGNIEVDDLTIDLCNWYKTEDCSLLSGPTSTGKTTKYGKIASLLGLPFRVQNFDRYTDPDKILGQFMPTGVANEFKFVESGFTKCFKYGGFYLADEINMVDGDITALFHSVLDGMAQIVLPTNEVVNKHPLFKMGAGINESYSGTKPLNIAFLRRMKRKDRLKSMDESTIIELACKQFESEISANLVTKHQVSEMAKIVKKIETKYENDMIRDASIGVTHLYSWVRHYINIKDMKKSAISTIVNLSCEDPDVNKEVESNIINQINF